MGVGLIIAAVTIGATVATTLFAKGPRSTKGADMAPALSLIHISEPTRH